ncbi:sugar phosphate isomerase/epimerase [archaeon]|jgi:sugar phosphate isomerase/epimerase|nr:sugar phosphate isomerase/epimerase [archaeon]
MTRPLIGYSLNDQELRHFKLEDYPEFETFEIRNSSEARQNIKKILDRIKKPLGGIPASLHSGLGLIFSCERHGCPEFKEAEMAIFRADIIAAKIIGVDRINFHIDKRVYDKEEKELFRKLIDFSNEKGIKLIVESNTFSRGEYILDFLETFPEVNYCLDFGHLNTSLQNNFLEMPLEEFLDRIAKRTIHIHAHNNFGKDDEHAPLDKGNFPYKLALEKLTNVERIICENRTKEDALKTKEVLEEFYHNN